MIKTYLWGIILTSSLIVKLRNIVFSNLLRKCGIVPENLLWLRSNLIKFVINPNELGIGPSIILFATYKYSILEWKGPKSSSIVPRNRLLQRSRRRSEGDAHFGIDPLRLLNDGQTASRLGKFETSDGIVPKPLFWGRDISRNDFSSPRHGRILDVTLKSGRNKVSTIVSVSLSHSTPFQQHTRRVKNRKSTEGCNLLVQYWVHQIILGGFQQTFQIHLILAESYEGSLVISPSLPSPLSFTLHPFPILSPSPRSSTRESKIFTCDFILNTIY